MIETVRFEPLVGIMRFNRDGFTAEFTPPKDGVCTIAFETNHVVWIHGMKADMTRHMWRDFVRVLDKHGVKTIKAKRDEDNSLPLGKVHDDRIEISIEELKVRFKIK